VLSDRQAQILRIAVDAYVDSGKAVGSVRIADRTEIKWSPSTVRSELAALEFAGYLTHLHTSAGRVPTDAGYRFLADSLLEGTTAPAGMQTVDLTAVRREVDEAMRETTSTLSQITDLLALVTAPPQSAARIHRIELLAVRARVVTLVVISSTGEVARRVFSFDRPVDPGLVEWASSYLNERLSGVDLGARRISDLLEDPELSSTEAAFIDTISDGFAGLETGSDQALYLDGTSRLLSEEHAADLPDVNDVIGALERRRSLLSVLRSALDEPSVFLWIGGENPEPELRSVSVIGANYGLGYRNLGAVGVVGPLRMDYATAISSVRTAADELSRFFETVYEN
jgi:heat-inducible transcriptional repressor